MALNWVDWVGFVGFSIFVIVYAMYKSRKENSAEDYFLGGRSMGWILVGFSLIASNISSEHFVGMSGAAYGGAGLAIASYEYIAAATLVLIAFFLLPLYLKTGIYTLPEFLQFRYGKEPRTLMAFYMMVAYCFVALAAVLYAGAIALKAMFGLDLAWGIWAVGISAGIYTAFGGLKAVAWSDLLHGVALLIGGTVVTVIGLSRVGGVGEFFAHNRDKFHLILPANHPDIPWTALLVGIWIPNLFYWGLNQFITQRALAAKSLAQGQLGIMFAAFMKIFIPFIIVLPGIIAYELYKGQIGDKGDMAYPTLIKEIIPFGLRGMLLAALSGAVMSALSALLNSASTIWTMDFYQPYLNKNASPQKIVQIGRISTVVFTILACLIAPLPGKFEGVFRYIQMIWGFISPGIVTVFVFGLVFRKAPKSAALAAMILGPAVYGILLWKLPQVAFLNHMAITFAILCVVMGVMTVIKPLPAPVEFNMKGEVDLTHSPLAKILGVVVLITVALFYIILR